MAFERVNLAEQFARISDRFFPIRKRSISSEEKVKTSKKATVADTASSKQAQKQPTPIRPPKSVDPNEPMSIIQDDLNMEVVEFFNGKKYKKLLNSKQISGSLYAYEGMIDSLVVDLPKGERIDISYAEIHGNSFQYQGVDGGDYNGIIYETEKNTYIVTLNDGPHAGSRIKFKVNDGDDRYRMPYPDEYMADQNIQEDPYLNDERRPDRSVAQDRNDEDFELREEERFHDNFAPQDSWQDYQRGGAGYDSPGVDF